MRIRKVNPAMTKGFKEVEYTGEAMTISGTILKIFILLGVVVLGFLYSWFTITYSPSAMITISTITFGIAIFTAFNPKIARFTGIIYAGLEGLTLGCISHILELIYSGVVVPAILITIVCVIVTIGIYGKRPDIAQRRRKAIMIGVVTVLVSGLVGILLSFMGIVLPIYNNGVIGIIFSLVVIVLATLCLIQDYDFVLRSIETGAPKHMEWYGAFSLMITLIWIYVEGLNLLAIISSND